MTKNPTIKWFKSFKSSHAKISAVMIITLCLAGLLYQISDVSTLYFSYFTRSEIQISIPVLISPPSLSLCFRYRDLIDFDRVSIDPRFTNQTFKRPLNHTSSESIYFESYFSVHDIFELTPNIDKLFGTSGLYLLPNRSIASHSCLYRKPGSFIANPKTIEECEAIFAIEKYIQREYICYYITVPDDSGKKYDITHVSFAKEWFGLIYQLILNPTTFKYGMYFTVYIHESGSHKLYDSTLTNIMVRGFSKHGITVGEDVKISYYSSTIQKLPAPYDTDCYNISEKYNTRYKSDTGAIFQCVNRIVKKKLDLVSPLGQIFWHYNISLARLSVDWDARIFERALKECYFKANACHFKSIATKVTITPSDHFSVSVFWPQDTVNIVR